MILGRFRKKQKTQRRTARKATRVPENLSTKDDIKALHAEIVASREVLLSHIQKIPDHHTLGSLLIEHITEPLKQQFISSANPIKRIEAATATGEEPITQKSLDAIIDETKRKLDMLSQRHVKILDVLARNRGEWLSYQEIGQYCSPPLTGSCIRGYVADLINMYQISIEKKSMGKQSRVRVTERMVKDMAIAKLSGS